MGVSINTPVPRSYLHREDEADRSKNLARCGVRLSGNSGTLTAFCTTRIRSTSPNYPLRWYDTGMTTTKIAITLPEEQLARVNRAVRAGRADSVSGYITRVLVEQEREESLRTLVRDLIAQHGEPTQQEKMWAKRVLRPRRRA
jgi:hypothetical protein